jgi:hypothetical protein
VAVIGLAAAILGLAVSSAQADWDNDGLADLVAINRHGGSGQTEIHVLSGASQHQQFIAHIATGLHPTDSSDWELLTANKDYVTLDIHFSWEHDSGDKPGRPDNPGGKGKPNGKPGGPKSGGKGGRGGKK